VKPMIILILSLLVLLLPVPCCPSAPAAESVTVCLTELWKVYDYQDENGGYAELVTWAWTVETREEFGAGMVGFRYVGFIRLTRILWYDSNDEDTQAWWREHSGKTGTEQTAEAATRQILKCSGHTGEIEIVWR